MRVVGLISGGKDSCYNLMQCVAAGHEIVALANLYPEDAEEIDSFMFQSVGHVGIQLYADAVGVPLFRRSIKGKSISITSIEYSPTPGDEVEDLYELLKEVKESCDVDAISVGAVLSDYQRVRVECVCTRLGLTSLSYLWRRNQSELLQEMIETGVHAILIKVAALGLKPHKHLGKSLSEMSDFLHHLNHNYNVHVCGEGGEYETFTLDCPLFTKKIVVDEVSVVETPGDVGYIVFKSLKLVDKDLPNESTMKDRILAAGVKGPLYYLNDLNLAVEEQQFEDQAKENSTEHKDIELEPQSFVAQDNKVFVSHSINTKDSKSWWSPGSPIIGTTSTGYTWIMGVEGSSMEKALESLEDAIKSAEVSFEDVVSVTLYVNDLEQYQTLNSLYIKYWKGLNPPTRACVQVPLREGIVVQISVIAWRESHVSLIPNEDENTLVHRPRRQTLHVQSLSHWAPAMIGPYSQAVSVGAIVHISGTIPLVPGTMNTLGNEDIELQCRLTLRHIGRVLSAATTPSWDFRIVVQGVCYVTSIAHLALARRMMARVSESQISIYVVVPCLPKGVPVEWHVWGHRDNQSFHYDETGLTNEEIAIKVRRRWSHKGSPCALIATATSKPTTQVLSVQSITEFLQYSLGKMAIPNDDTFCPVMVTLYYRKDYVTEDSLVQSLTNMDTIIGVSPSLNLVPVLAIEDKITLMGLYGTTY